MNVTIEPLDCGTLTAGGGMFEHDAGTAPMTVPVPSWLIRHPSGTVLFDCGMHEDLTRPGELLDTVQLFFGVGVDRDRLVAEQLRRREVDPAEVAVVVASHLHFDHVGGLAQLPNARLVVQAEEWAAGFDPDLSAANSYLRSDFDLGHDVVTVDGEHDLFGDGRVSCVPTPGHTPGHQSLKVRLDRREVVLCGDCAYFERTLVGGSLPPVAHDPQRQAESLAALRSMRAGGAHLVPGHDPGVMAALPSRLR